MFSPITVDTQQNFLLEAQNSLNWGQNPQYGNTAIMYKNAKTHFHKKLFYDIYCLKVKF